MVSRDLGRLVVGCMAFFVVCVVLSLYGCPKYRVWEQGLAGQAELKRAEQAKQIAIEEAKAKRESATELAKAEVERAKGVAEANKIIGDSLRGNEDYLHYLWIDALQATAAQGDKVIYIPTEANLPLLEASRLEDAPTPAETE